MMKKCHHFSLFFAIGGIVAALCAPVIAHAGTATSISGLYYTGVDNGGGLLAGAATDSHWQVTYSSKGDGYEGPAYVVSSTYIDHGWAPNTSSAQWITAPGAKASSSTSSSSNVGGDYLPGNGIAGGSGAASYLYTLAFTIEGSDVGSVVTNSVSITLTLAADDQAKIYVNPALNTADNSLKTGPGATTASDTITTAWDNVSSTTLKNGVGGNATFKVGTNYLVILVENTNNITKTSTSTALNPSGLLVYQIGATATLIDGKPVPEVGAWLPVVGALGLFFWRRFRKPDSRAISS